MEIVTFDFFLPLAIVRFGLIHEFQIDFTKEIVRFDKI